MAVVLRCSPTSEPARVRVPAGLNGGLPVGLQSSVRAFAKTCCWPPRARYEFRATVAAPISPAYVVDAQLPYPPRRAMSTGGGRLAQLAAIGRSGPDLALVGGVGCTHPQVGRDR